MPALYYYIKKYTSESAQCVSLISQLTGISLQPPTNTTSLVLHNTTVPLFLRDPIVIFLQLYLNFPPNHSIGIRFTQYLHISLHYTDKLDHIVLLLFTGYFEQVLRLVYNLMYVKALVYTTCKFDEEERQAWLTEASSSRRGSAVSARNNRHLPVSQTSAMLQTVISFLSKMKFYPADIAVTSVSMTLRQYHV